MIKSLINFLKVKIEFVDDSLTDQRRLEFAEFMLTILDTRIK